MIIAAIDIDALIPLIVGVFWVIAQIAGAAAKKKPAPPRRPAPKSDNNDGTVEDSFAELMRKLGGVQEFKIPVPKPEATPKKTARPEGLAPPITSEFSGRAMPPAEPKLKPLKPVEVPDADIRPTMSSFKSSMPAMKIPAMSMSFQGLEKRSGGYPKVGKIIDPSDKQTLRRAVLGHIILGKPKALEGWDTGRIE